LVCVSQAETAPAPGRSLRSAAYLTAGMGLLHSILFLVSFGILRTTPPANAADLVTFYSGSGSGRRWVLVAALYLIPLAAIAFIWFIVALRVWVGAHGRPEQAFFSTVQLVSGTVFIAILLVAAAAFSIDAAVAEFTNAPLNTAQARLFPEYAKVIVVVLAMRIAAMFVIATSSIGRHAGLLPRWFIVVGYLVGAFLLLAASLNALLMIVLPVWMIVLCMLIVVRARRLPG
jgi:hypothetical protein